FIRVPFGGDFRGQSAVFRDGHIPVGQVVRTCPAVVFLRPFRQDGGASPNVLFDVFLQGGFGNAQKPAGLFQGLVGGIVGQVHQSVAVELAGFPLVVLPTGLHITDRQQNFDGNFKFIGGLL